MDTRDKEVLNMQFTLIPILAKAWNKSYSELSEIFSKYKKCEKNRKKRFETSV